MFTLVKSFCMKFCRYVSNSYPHVSTNFCRFILIFHQMVLIFQRVPIIFTLSSFEYSPRKWKCSVTALRKWPSGVIYGDSLTYCWFSGTRCGIHGPLVVVIWILCVAAGVEVEVGWCSIRSDLKTPETSVASTDPAVLLAFHRKYRASFLLQFVVSNHLLPAERQKLCDWCCFCVIFHSFCEHDNSQTHCSSDVRNWFFLNYSSVFENKRSK